MMGFPTVASRCKKSRHPHAFGRICHNCVQRMPQRFGAHRNGVFRLIAVVRLAKEGNFEGMRCFHGPKVTESAARVNRAALLFSLFFPLVFVTGRDAQGAHVADTVFVHAEHENRQERLGFGVFHGVNVARRADLRKNYFTGIRGFRRKY